MESIKETDKIERDLALPKYGAEAEIISVIETIRDLKAARGRERIRYEEIVENCSDFLGEPRNFRELLAVFIDRNKERIGQSGQFNIEILLNNYKDEIILPRNIAAEIVRYMLLDKKIEGLVLDYIGRNEKINLGKLINLIHSTIMSENNLSTAAIQLQTAKMRDFFHYVQGWGFNIEKIKQEDDIGELKKLLLPDVEKILKRVDGLQRTELPTVQKLDLIGLLSCEEDGHKKLSQALVLLGMYAVDAGEDELFGQIIDFCENTYTFGWYEKTYRREETTTWRHAGMEAIRELQKYQKIQSEETRKKVIGTNLASVTLSGVLLTAVTDVATGLTVVPVLSFAVNFMISKFLPEYSLVRGSYREKLKERLEKDLGEYEKKWIKVALCIAQLYKIESVYKQIDTGNEEIFATYAVLRRKLDEIFDDMRYARETLEGSHRLSPESFKVARLLDRHE